MKKKIIITTIIAVVSLAMTSCGHDIYIDNSEQYAAKQGADTTSSVDETLIEATEQNGYLDESEKNTAMQEFDTTDETSIEATEQNVQVTESEQNAAKQESDTTSPVNEFIIEATSSVATAIWVDAGQYFVDDKELCNKIIHNVVQDDGDFGSYLIEKHPALKGIEYIVEFNGNYAPCNSFCYQSQEPLVSIGCSGETRKLSDWGFETWEDVLNHYGLESLES